MKKIVWCSILLFLLCGCQSVVDEQNDKETWSSQITISVQKTEEIEKTKETVTNTPTPTITEGPITECPTIIVSPTVTVSPTPTVEPDTIAPVIEGLMDKEVYVGDTISYKKDISVSDDKDKDVSLEIDASAVKLDVPGEYEVIYTATDASGNKTVETITVLVKEMDQTEVEVNKMADELLEELIIEGMSKWDICYKLWNWCRTKIKYSYSAGDRSSIYSGAYEGLKERNGDCYVYYATFTVLLQKCEIETLEVRRCGGQSNHWWNLVNLGDGWYHCDSSPRKAGHKYKCFMQTDAQVQEYTDFYKEHPNYYTFDESLYPERETTIIYDGNLS